MGVRGLSTFIDDNKNIFLSDHKLHDTRVVIDGSNLFHFLYYHYKISHQFGGDYDHFARKCKRFFNILKECKITPFVVFDGGYDPDDRKLPEVLNRMNDRRKRVGLIIAKGRGCVLPILTYETFRQVLLELNIAHVSCVYEADREIAVLAKKWKCPVLSNDSDFFIYRLEGGFIPLDYINMTLCVYNTETQAASVLDHKMSVADNDLVYIPVKYYNYETLLKKLKKTDDYILPLLATLVGNDYVDSSVLHNFNYTLRAPKNPSKRSINVKACGRMEAVLYWIDTTVNETEALEQILGSVPLEKRDSLKEIVTTSINEYKYIDNFSAFDIETVLNSFHRDKLPCEESNEVCPADSDTSELYDFKGSKLPDWFVKRLRNCEMNGSFLQNVVINRRVILNCQVEILRETSSYAASRKLRSYLYKIILSSQADNAGEEPSQDVAVVEYDRQGKNTKKFHVEPLNILPDEVAEMPAMEKIPSMSRLERRNILFASFDMGVSCYEDSMKESTHLLLLVLSMWVKCAQPKVTESHLSALIIGVFALHLKELEWLKMKKSLGFKPYKPELYQDIVDAFTALSDKRAEFFKKHLEKYFSRPAHSVKIPRDNKIVHGYAQFQACFLDTLYLNQVLLKPVCIPSPSMILNCTVVYNLCRDLEGRLHSELFCADLLGRGSPLHDIFLSWKQKVIELCKENCFETETGAKKKNKSRVRKKAQSEGMESKDTIIDSESSENEMLTLNCDISNKFSLLDCGDFP